VRMVLMIAARFMKILFYAIVSLLDIFLPQAPWGGSWLLVAVVVDVLYLVAYEAWEHSAD